MGIDKDLSLHQSNLRLSTWMAGSVICGQNYKSPSGFTQGKGDAVKYRSSFRGGSIGVAYGVITFGKGSRAMLTPKQEVFARKIVEGMTQADAYRASFSCSRMTDKTVWEKASRLMADDKVKARVKELRDKINDEAIMSAQKRLEWLTKVIQSEEETTGDKLKAVDLMNKMSGEYVQKIAAEVQTETTINIELVDDDE